jgi:hypothetical protein
MWSSHKALTFFIFMVGAVLEIGRKRHTGGAAFSLHYNASRLDLGTRIEIPITCEMTG